MLNLAFRSDFNLIILCFMLVRKSTDFEVIIQLKKKKSSSVFRRKKSKFLFMSHKRLLRQSFITHKNYSKSLRFGFLDGSLERSPKINKETKKIIVV